MHIGILRTDSVRPEWVPTYGEYPDMFERLLLAEERDLILPPGMSKQGSCPTALRQRTAF